MKRYILAITGASGMAYAVGVYEQLRQAGVEIHLVISENGKTVLKEELGLDENGFSSPRLKRYRNGDLSAPIASGSFACEAMLIVPCSMATLAAVANGISANLIQRAADVCLKERRKLIIVPRETPLNTIQLRNMLKISESGGVILPAMPAFYRHPQNVEDLVAFVVSRIMQQAGISVDSR